MVTMRGDAEPGSLGVDAIVSYEPFRNRLGIKDVHIFGRGCPPLGISFLVYAAASLYWSVL